MSKIITAIHRLDNVAERLYRRYHLDDNGCWIWQGCKNKEGYGRISISKHEGMYTHRASYEVYHGRSVHPDLHVLHKCNNPSCINPNHLYERYST